MRLPVTPALHGSRHLTRCGHPGQRGGWRARVGLCTTIYCENLYTQKSVAGTARVASVVMMSESAKPLAPCHERADRGRARSRTG